MANIKVTLDYPIANGLPLTFKSPTDCSQVTGLRVQYPSGTGSTSYKTFQFADAHGNNVGSIDLFASNVLVKVILDVDDSKAYVQNADTNAYLEGELAKKYSPTNKPTPTDIGAATVKSKSAQISTSWTANGEGFKQNVTVSGILEDDKPVIGLVQSGAIATDTLLREAWNMVSRIECLKDNITVYCDEGKPEVAIPIQIQWVR